MASLGEATGALESLVGTVGSLFGTSTSGNSSTEGVAQSITKAKQSRSGLQTEQLQLEDAAVQQIIRDVLGGADGLASIFAAEQNSGIFKSSVAAQAAGDLASKLVGEIAKITGKNVITNEEEAEEESVTDQTMSQTTKTKSSDGGVLSGVGDFFGF